MSMTTFAPQPTPVLLTADSALLRLLVKNVIRGSTSDLMIHVILHVWQGLSPTTLSRLVTRVLKVVLPAPL